MMKMGVDKRALKELNNHLEKLGLKVKSCKGAIIDVTIIESSSRPNRTIELTEEEDQEETLVIQESSDPDARRLKKESTVTLVTAAMFGQMKAMDISKLLKLGLRMNRKPW